MRPLPPQTSRGRRRRHVRALGRLQGLRPGRNLSGPADGAAMCSALRFMLSHVPGREGRSQWWRHEQGHTWWSARHQMGLPAHCLWEVCQLPPAAAPGQPLRGPEGTNRDRDSCHLTCSVCPQSPFEEGCTACHVLRLGRSGLRFCFVTDTCTVRTFQILGLASQGDSWAGQHSGHVKNW